jgi:RimJ/RimL family protein N-acetyltransferase
MINLVPFEPWHLEILDPWSDVSFTSFMATSEEYRRQLHLSGPAFSGFTPSGEYLGTVGIIKFPWGTTAECWMALDKNIRSCRKGFHRFVKERIDTAFDLMSIKRMQAIVEVSDQRAAKWIERLDFVRETGEEGMREFGPGGTPFHMYARIQS